MCSKIHIFCIIFMWVGANKIEVKVKQGILLGLRENSLFDGRLYFAFYGVPYAQPPIGKLRFKDPRLVKKWNGTFDASEEYHGACAQTHIIHKPGMYGVEDCLYLNIYSPHIPKTNKANLLPVIVWIHGYAFASCYSHLHGPDFFINNGIIVVTLAHRIGVFGFLKYNDNDTHANMGLKDIAMGLKWIRSNIKSFGGDKTKVTLMGSGSGATFISLLMTTEVSKLFSKVILQSGAIFSPSIFQSDPALQRKKLLQELKTKHLKLNSAPSKEIIEAAYNIYIRNNKEMEKSQRPIVPFTPIIEPDSNTSLLVWGPEEFYEYIKRNNIYLNKPIIIGYNTQESISEVIPFIHNPYHLKTFIKFFKFMVPFSDGCSYDSSSKSYKKVASVIKDRYFNVSSHTGMLLESLLKYASDLLTFPILKFVKTHLGVSKSSIYMYKFDYRGTLNAVKASSIAESKVKVSGVASGDEICYLLRCEPFWEAYAKMNKGNDTNKDKQFIKDISLLWANFAKFGNPTSLTSNNNITWLPLTKTINNVLLIRKYFKLVNTKIENSMFDFWNTLYETYYKKEVCASRHDEL